MQSTDAMMTGTSEAHKSMVDPTEQEPTTSMEEHTNVTITLVNHTQSQCSSLKGIHTVQCS